MSIALLDLPLNFIIDVIGFVDDRSCLRLRKVCKKTKDVVDSSILNTRKTIVDSFNDEGKQQKIKMERSFSIIFTEIRDWSLWKIGLKKLFKKRKFVNFNYRHQLTITAFVRVGKFGLFFDYLKPIIQGAEFHQLVIHNSVPEMCNIFAPFFTGKSITAIMVDTPLAPETDRDCDLILKFIKKVRPELFLCNFVPFNATVELLLQIADIVKVITVRLEKKSERNPQREIIPLVQDFLCRNCETLWFNATDNGSVSLAETERLIQIFHRSGKKVFFGAARSAGPMEAQIGEYILGTRGNDNETMLINHVDLLMR